MTKKISIYIGGIILLIISFFLNIVFGGTNIPFDTILENISNSDSSIYTILWKIRIPRAIVSLITGATLAASGTLIKAVMKNPLADTGVLGIQSGSTLVAMLIILVFPEFYGFLPIGSFIGGFVVYLFLMLLCLKDGIRPIKLVLTGIAINGFLGSFIGLISIYNSDKIQSALNWLNGSLAGVTMDDAKMITVYGIIGIVISLFFIGKCNLLLLDDVTVSNLGENLTLTRFLISIVAVFLASISVSVVGMVGFVGLVIPHIAKLIIGQDHKHLLPFSILLGAIFVLLADAIMKILFSPIEIPIGIVISFVCSPFFLYLLRKQI